MQFLLKNLSKRNTSLEKLIKNKESFKLSSGKDCWILRYESEKWVCYNTGLFPRTEPGDFIRKFYLCNDGFYRKHGDIRAFRIESL